MSRRWCFLWGVLAALIPISTFPLGLGEITLRSGLNQPLDAEIEVLSLGPDELDRATIQLASPEAFSQRRLDRPQVLSHLRFETHRRPDGTPYVKVTSVRPVREPFLDFLVELSGTKGRLLRQYTLLLDPPKLAWPEIAPALRHAVIASAEQTEKSSEVGSEQAKVSPSQPGLYGPIGRNETLWAIAKRLRPDKSISVPQMAISLFRANPEAFAKQNINNLRAGEALRMPPLDVIAAISRQKAIDEVQQQTYAWRTDVQAPGTLASAPVATGQRKAVPAEEQPMGEPVRLKVVSPTVSGTPNAAAATTAATTEQQATALREELALANGELGTQRQENEQLRARIVELEGMVSSMERLITLKTEELIQLQARMNVLGQAVEAKGTADSAPAAEPNTHSKGLAAGSKSATTSQRAQVLPMASTGNTSSDRGALGNPFVLGALFVGILPLFMALWWVAKRRRGRGTAIDSPETLEGLNLSPSASQENAAETSAASVTTGATRSQVERPVLAEARLDQDPKQAFRTTPATSVVADAAIANRAVPSIDVPLFDFGTDEIPEIAPSAVVDPVEAVELRSMVDHRADDLERFAIDIELEFGGGGPMGGAGLSKSQEGIHAPEADTGDEDRYETLRIERQAEADDHTVELGLAPQDRDETAGLERQKQPSIVDSTLEFELPPKDTNSDQETELDAAERSLEAALLKIGNDPDRTSCLAPEMHESNIESLWASSRVDTDGQKGETACEEDGDKTLAVDANDLPKFATNPDEIVLEEGWQALASTGTGNDFTGADFVLDQEVPSGFATMKTKLDLAKVYIELGVFEDAGSLLQEVKEQGDDAQRQEAQELLHKIA